MSDKSYILLCGKMEEVCQDLPENSVDAIVTDAPYGIKFMGKKWDYNVPSVYQWEQALRVLKPGGYMIAFGGSRTFHRMAVNIEDAGFEIRDTIMWIYAQGFPKSMNIGNGWGTALKPAHEQIILARKSLDGTVVENMKQWGTGGINIDGCRIDLNGDYKSKANGRPSLTGLYDNYNSTQANKADHVGRFPANVIHDGSDEVIALFPDSKGQLGRASCSKSISKNNIYGKNKNFTINAEPRNDSGSAARFFYCAKASNKDRNDGVDMTIETEVGHNRFDTCEICGGTILQNPDRPSACNCNEPIRKHNTFKGNSHPTVKPTALMQYLVKLVTPKGGLVLDPFMGSGSTGKATILEGFEFIGIDMDKQWIPIAESRIKFAINQSVNDKLR